MIVRLYRYTPSLRMFLLDLSSFSSLFCSGERSLFHFRY
jgi:hypothetical protein